MITRKQANDYEKLMITHALRGRIEQVHAASTQGYKHGIRKEGGNQTKEG